MQAPWIYRAYKFYEKGYKLKSLAKVFKVSYNDMYYWIRRWQLERADEQSTPVDWIQSQDAERWLHSVGYEAPDVMKVVEDLAFGRRWIGVTEPPLPGFTKVRIHKATKRYPNLFGQPR